MCLGRCPRTRFLALVLAAALVMMPALSGCRGLSHPEEFPTSGSSASSVEAVSNPQTITREEFGDQWPFEFDSCEVGAEPDASGDPVLRLTTEDGTVYALNDLSGNDGLPKAEDLVRPCASIGPIRSFALGLVDLE
ncbi:superoxide dismutase [Collinsella aerofaciens]|uniref:superoxide dismutase n=1 Tax=Collinsella aerofaciens TaxID=74426 RepID=UPI001260BED0|nr:superoxide dismutase [Collinsella aerofaciens]